MAPKILVIDDDSQFAKQLLKEGERIGADIDWYNSFSELGRVGRLGEYDCVVADLSSDPVTGIEIAQYVTAFFSDLPVILVSDDSADEKVGFIRRLPQAIQARIPKAAGASYIMRTAVEMAATRESELICPAMPRSRAPRYELTA